MSLLQKMNESFEYQAFLRQRNVESTKKTLDKAHGHNGCYCVVDYKSEANYSVYISNSKVNADKLVYISETPSGSSFERGVWYKKTVCNDNTTKLFFTKYRTEADFKIFQVDYKSQARNKN